MKYKKWTFGVMTLVIMFGVVGTTWAKTGNPVFDYFELWPTIEGDTAQKTFTLGAYRARIGQSIPLKYKIKNNNQPSENVLVRVYRLDHTDSDPVDAGCVEFQTGHGATLLQEINIPNFAANEMIEGETSFTTNAINGFEVSDENGEIINNIVFQVTSPNNSLGLECIDSNIPMSIDSETAPLPDYSIESVRVNPSEPSSLQVPITVSFQIKNTGANPDVGVQVKVCLERRQEGTFPDGYPHRFCELIDAPDTHQITAHEFKFTPSLKSFSLNQFADNARLTLGKNRLALTVNENANLPEESYDNEEVFYVTVGEVEQQVVAPVEKPIEKIVTNNEPTELKNGMLLKSPKHTAVYYLDNGKRRPFAHVRIYNTWYKDFSGVKTLTVGAVEAIPLGD